MSRIREAFQANQAIEAESGSDNREGIVYGGWPVPPAPKTAIPAILSSIESLSLISISSFLIMR